MEVDSFTVYIDRLADGSVESLDLALPADFLEVNDGDLSYQSPIQLKGQVYVAETDLVMCFDIKALANMRCTLCNEPVTVPIDLKKIYFAESLETMKSGLFSFKELVRETILIETPRFVKCGGKDCKQKNQFTKYLRTEEDIAKENEGKDYRPFADLNFEE